MSFFNLDYFKCEAFEFNFRMYTFSGFWPLKTKNRFEQILFSLFSFLSYFSLTSLLINVVIDVYFVRRDTIKLTNDICFISIGGSTILKTFILFYKFDLVNELKENIIEYKNSRTDEIEKNLLEKSNKQLSLIMKVLYVCAGLCVIIMVLHPYFDSTINDNKVILPYRLPGEEWSDAVYVSVYVYQFLAVISVVINILSLDGMFCGFVLRILAHYNIIIKNFKSLDDDFFMTNPRTSSFLFGKEKLDNYNAKVDEILKENIKLHTRILHEINILINVYKIPTLFHFLEFMGTVGSVVMDFLILKEVSFIQILQKLFYLAIATVDSFLFCISASTLESKSFEVGIASYNIRWHLVNRKIRKNLLIFIMKSYRAPKIRAANIFLVNLEGFVKLLKASYDLVAFAYQTARKH
uniref:Odorant receptor n=1 Tax=Pediculus humanus TaxID=121225 RepID=A0A0U3UHB1_9NEOP|nr:OR4 [Pediculus humanus]